MIMMMMDDDDNDDDNNDDDNNDDNDDNDDDSVAYNLAGMNADRIFVIDEVRTMNVSVE